MLSRIIISGVFSALTRLVFWVSLGTLAWNLFTKAFGIDEGVKAMFANLKSIISQFFGFTESARLAKEGLEGLTAGVLDLALAFEGIPDVIEFRFESSLFGFEFISKKSKADLANAITEKIEILKEETQKQVKQFEATQDLATRTGGKISNPLTKAIETAGVTPAQFFREKGIPDILVAFDDIFGKPETWQEVLAHESDETVVRQTLYVPSIE